MSERDKNLLLVLIGVVCITILESIALHKNINGIALSSAIGGITLCIGYILKSVKNKLKKNE